MAYCGKCGNQIEESVKFCTSCGNPMGVAQQPHPSHRLHPNPRHRLTS